MKQSILNYSNCPKCGTSLLGNVIPEELRREYSNRRHFTRLIELRDWNTKRLTGWECPDCGEQFKNDGHRHR